jgi:hypothetical protein
VDPDGSLWAWGSNNSGALGLGTAGPQPVGTPQKVPGLAGVTQLAAGNETSMALRSDGTLLAWGFEGDGLRGDGIDRGQSSLPVPTPVTSVSRVTRIALAGTAVLVLAPAKTMPAVVGELRASALGSCTTSGCPCRSCPCLTPTGAATTLDTWSRRVRRPAPWSGRART